MKKWFYPVSLILIFIILTAAVIPDGYVYGSNTDWLSQHVTLAETIRSACLKQHTLLPSWIGLGGGSNGYQFAYYGFLRPDIMIGMPAAAGAYDKYHDRIYADCLPDVCSPHVCLAAGRTGGSTCRMAWKHPFSDCRMSLPHAPSDHVCKLSAVSAGSFPVHQEKALQVAAAVPRDDLSLQLLLCPLCFCRSRMVLEPDGGQGILERVICEAVSSLCPPCRGNVDGAPAPYSSGAVGAQTERPQVQDGFSSWSCSAPIRSLTISCLTNTGWGLR